MLTRPLVFLDLETTGATASRDRITEIGLIEVEHGCYSGEWSTLVNPQMRIPPFIESLTGISNDMVAQAPGFADVAQDLRARLEGKVLVAHNARFDYGFLQSEFQRLGITYHSDLICTVKLSRKLFPGHARHNLDTLMERHGVSCDARHRALGDARVLWDLTQKWRDEIGVDALCAAAAAQLKTPALPPQLPASALDGIPRTPGVYVFYGDNDVPLFVGKGVDLRARVLAHFRGDQRSARDRHIVQHVQRIAWTETAGELGALLEQARLVRELRPVLNQRRRDRDLWVYAWDPAAGAAPRLMSMADLDFSGSAGFYGAFRSKRAARDTLCNLARKFELCPIASGLEEGDGPCSSYHDQHCRGVCIGLESALQHGLRLMQALSGLEHAAWPFGGRIGVRESSGMHSEIHVFEHWRHLGTVRAGHELDGLDPRAAFDPDTYRILQRCLAGRRQRFEIVRLAA